MPARPRSSGSITVEIDLSALHWQFVDHKGRTMAYSVHACHALSRHCLTPSS